MATLELKIRKETMEAVKDLIDAEFEGKFIIRNDMSCDDYCRWGLQITESTACNDKNWEPFYIAHPEMRFMSNMEKLAILADYVRTSCPLQQKKGFMHWLLNTKWGIFSVGVFATILNIHAQVIDPAYIRLFLLLPLLSMWGFVGAAMARTKQLKQF